MPGVAEATAAMIQPALLPVPSSDFEALADIGATLKSVLAEAVVEGRRWCEDSAWCRR